MRKFRPKRGPKTLLDRVRDLDPEFADAVFSYTEDELRNKVVLISRDEEVIEEARKNDPDLRSLKEQLDVAKETYTAPLKASRLRKKLILQVLSERGKI